MMTKDTDIREGDDQSKGTTSGGRGGRSGKARVPKPPGNSPLTLGRGADKLRQALLRYHVDEDVADVFSNVGVAAFTYMEDDDIRTLFGESSPIHAAIVLGVRKAICKEMGSGSTGDSSEYGGRGGGSRGSDNGGGNSSGCGSGSGGGSNGRNQANQDVEGADGGGIVAPGDPYIYGEVDAPGKNAVYEIFGRVGGGEATIGARMPTSVKVGESRKNFQPLLLTRLGMELQSTHKDNPVLRAEQWTCVISMMDNKRWGKLGQMSWNVNVGGYIIEVLRGLKLAADVRQPCQCSCQFLNNIKQCQFATDPALLESLLYCKWDTGLVQIESFESTEGGAGANRKTGDAHSRHIGLVWTIRNFMWFMAAYVHEIYIDVLEPLALGVQNSENLFRVSGALLVHLINEELGGVFRSIPIKSTVDIADVAFPLAGPRQVAAALRAAGARLIVIFSSRQGLRDRQTVFDEESSDRSSVAALIESVNKGGKKRSGGNEEYESEDFTISKRKRKALAKKEKMESGKGVDLGQSVHFVTTPHGQGTSRGGQQQAVNLGGGRQGASQPINLGGAAQPGYRQSLGICNKHMAGLLQVKTASNAGEKCDRSSTDCRFSHYALRDIDYNEATRCVLAMKDEDLRKRITAKMVTSKSLFKK
jgi:hypothetical protein